MIWRNRSFWMRLAALLCPAWVAVIGLISLLTPFGRFPFVAGSSYQPALGPAFWSAFVGALLIGGFCLGIPWVASALDPPRQED